MVGPAPGKPLGEGSRAARARHQENRGSAFGQARREISDAKVILTGDCAQFKALNLEELFIVSQVEWEAEAISRSFTPTAPNARAAGVGRPTSALTRPSRSYAHAARGNCSRADRARPRDQAWAAASLKAAGTIPLVAFFDLTYVENTGAAFGMGRGANKFLTAVSVGLVIALQVLRRRWPKDDVWLQWGPCSSRPARWETFTTA